MCPRAVVNFCAVHEEGPAQCSHVLCAVPSPRTFTCTFSIETSLAVKTLRFTMERQHYPSYTLLETQMLSDVRAEPRSGRPRAEGIVDPCMHCNGGLATV